MYKMNVSRFCVCILMCAGLILVGCASPRNAFTIDVEFQDAVQGLRKGDSVYLLGVPIAAAGNPFIANGRAMVPVILHDPKVFGPDSQVLFLLAPDQARPGHQCRIAYLHHVAAEPGQTRFRGFTSKIKLNLQMGGEKIESWWKNLGIPD